MIEIFGGDFSFLAEHLKIIDDRMVLVNPNFNKEVRQTDSEAL